MVDALKTAFGRATGYVDELAGVVTGRTLLRRLECFDISHLQGREVVASMVRFADGLSRAGAVVLIPGAPLIDITMFVQVAAVTLLPSTLIFLILMLNEPAFMGAHVNTRWQNIANWGIAIFVVAVSSLFGISVLFPKLLTTGSFAM